MSKDVKDELSVLEDFLGASNACGCDMNIMMDHVDKFKNIKINVEEFEDLLEAVINPLQKLTRWMVACHDNNMKIHNLYPDK